MEFSVDTGGESAGSGVAVVIPQGRLNMVSARRLREILGDLVSRGSTRIVVDLAETTFLDSSGLGALIAGLKSARQAGGDLRIARPTPSVLTVFELTNLDRVLRPRESVEGAFDD
jgi:anti-sigma B factor antagonist